MLCLCCEHNQGAFVQSKMQCPDGPLSHIGSRTVKAGSCQKDHPGHCYSYSSEQLAPISRKKAEGPSRSSTLPLSLAPFFINPVGPCRVPAHPFTFPGASHHSGSQTAGHRYLCPSLCLPKAPDGTPIVMTMTSGPTSDRQRGHFHLKRLIQFKFE